MAIASALLLFALALASTTPPPAPAAVAAGPWGGTGIAIDVTASGARVEFNCAHGTIDSPLVLDADGKFELRGSLVRERPGPVRENQSQRSEPVRWQGRLEGDTLHLAIVRPGATETSKPIAAKRGQSPLLRKCG